MNFKLGLKPIQRMVWGEGEVIISEQEGDIGLVYAKEIDNLNDIKFLLEPLCFSVQSKNLLVIFKMMKHII